MITLILNIVFCFASSSPEADSPFVFFHQRKTGGTWLRAAIYNSAIAQNITRVEMVVPCFGGTHCDTYSLDTVWQRCSRIKVVAMHAYYGHVDRYLHRKSPNAKSTCLTVFREPVDRILSCLSYRRLAQDLNTMTDEELLTTLRNGRDEYGNGCLNEPQRIFSGIADEDDLVDPSLSRLLVSLTLHHLRACKVFFFGPTLSEDLGNSFPWIRFPRDRLQANEKPHSPDVYEERVIRLILGEAVAESEIFSELRRRQTVGVTL